MFPYLKVLLLTGLVAVILESCSALGCAFIGGRCVSYFYLSCEPTIAKGEGCRFWERCCSRFNFS